MLLSVLISFDGIHICTRVSQPESLLARMFSCLVSVKAGYQRLQVEEEKHRVGKQVKANQAFKTAPISLGCSGS